METDRANAVPDVASRKTNASAIATPTEPRLQTPALTLRPPPHRPGREATSGWRSAEAVPGSSQSAGASEAHASTLTPLPQPGGRELSRALAAGSRRRRDAR